MALFKTATAAAVAACLVLGLITWSLMVILWLESSVLVLWPMVAMAPSNKMKWTLCALPNDWILNSIWQTWTLKCQLLINQVDIGLIILNYRSFFFLFLVCSLSYMFCLLFLPFISWHEYDKLCGAGEVVFAKMYVSTYNAYLIGEGKNIQIYIYSQLFY